MRSPLRIAAVALLCATAAPAQVANAPCYEPNLGQLLGGGDDWVYQGMPLGFAFPFQGTNYASIDIGTNGFVWLGSALGNLDPRCCFGAGGRFVAEAPSLAILWTDLICDSRDPLHGVYFHALPGRAVITWKGFNEYGQVSLQPDFTLQMQLTANGEVTFWYSPTTHIQHAFHSTLAGITPGNGSADPGSVDLSTALPLVAGAQTTIYELWPGGAFDLAQRTIEFVPNGPGWFVFDRPQCPFAAAAVLPFGVGCPPLTGNPEPEFYELWANGPQFDLANRGIDLIPVGGGYLVVPTTGAFFTGWQHALPLGDDQTLQVALPFALPTPAGAFASVGVCSNGFLQLSGSLLATPFPGTVEFQQEEPRIYGLWTDLDPTMAGQVCADAAGPGTWAFTWAGVAEFPGTTPSATFQIQVQASGTIRILWGAVQIATHSVLTGFSRGLGVPDPGNRDLSQVMPLQTGNGTQPLLLAARGVPVLGTTLPLELLQQPQGAVLAALVLGLQKLSLPLDALGMPGCFQGVSADATLFFASQPGATALPLPIPSTRNFLGYSVHAQGAQLAPGVNALGIAASNGATLRLGTF